MRKKLSLRFFHVILIVVISVLVGYGVGSYKVSASWDNFRPILGIENQNPPPGTNIDMALFYKVLSEVNERYYDKSKIDSTELLYGAISGMLSSLDDPYTSFFPPKDNETFKTQLAGEFSGIGAELTQNEQGQIAVVAPLDGSPAKAAGILPGDTILRVDDESTFGWDLPKAVEMIRGERGTQVVLTVLHPDANEPAEIAITRDTIEIPSVTSWFRSFQCNGESCQVVENCSTCTDVAYIRLSQFGEKTNAEWLAKVNELAPQIQSSSNFAGVVLDLRNNPGGILDDAVYIASEFVDQGKTVVIQEDGEGEQFPLTVSRRGQLLDIPVVVLVNQGSASASEILAGALRDHGRAEIIGENSFGKGTVQQPVEVEGGASVHVSVAKWLTPNGTWVHDTGLEPDTLVEYDASASAALEEQELDNQLIRAIRELSN